MGEEKRGERQEKRDEKQEERKGEREARREERDLGRPGGPQMPGSPGEPQEPVAGDYEIAWDPSEQQHVNVGGQQAGQVVTVHFKTPVLEHNGNEGSASVDNAQNLSTDVEINVSDDANAPFPSPALVAPASLNASVKFDSTPPSNNPIGKYVKLESETDYYIRVRPIQGATTGLKVTLVARDNG